ncbi:MAG: DUF1640 domain-containing protein [Planctomycetota bacterium]|jgi:hypothetical protein
MAHSITFDTLAFAKKLKEAGVPDAQAEVHAEAIAELIDERIATKQDLKELEITLRRDVKELELRLTIRLGAMMAASIAIIAALVKLL